MTSIKNILIAHDGSKSADSAIDDLLGSGLASAGVTATVISVAEVWLPPEPMTEAELPTEGMRAHLKANTEIFERVKESNAKAIERIKSHFPGWAVHSCVTSGSPAWEILYKAGELKSDLIVIGAQGLSAIDRLLLGSVSGRVVNEATCSVRVARGKVDVDAGSPRIVIAFDGSSGSRATVDAVTSRNWPQGTEARLVIASDGGGPFGHLGLKGEDIGDVAASIVEKLKASGLKADASIVEGNPKHVIVKEAEVFSADCIFVGATGHSPRITQAFLGSVSSAVVTRAHCSVEVVKPTNH